MQNEEKNSKMANTDFVDSSMIFGLLLAANLAFLMSFILVMASSFVMGYQCQECNNIKQCVTL